MNLRSTAGIFAAFLGLFVATGTQAQPLPVTVSVAGNTVSVDIGDSLGQNLAGLTLNFTEASGLSAASLGISAQLVSTSDLALHKRLPSLTQTSLPSGLPLLITIEPPVLAPLSFRRSYRVELHTHALAYSAGSRLRVMKAPLDGPFVDITEGIAPGSVRARGSSDAFSQFLVLLDNRPTTSVVTEKLSRLRGVVAALPAAERPAFSALLDSAESALTFSDFPAAIQAVDAFRARAASRAGLFVPDEWRAARDLVNHAGALLAGADTLLFSIGFLRDYG